MRAFFHFDVSLFVFVCIRRSMSETPLNDRRDASLIKSKSSVGTADGVRQRLKFDGESSGMTPDPKRSTEIVKQVKRVSRTLFLVSRLRGRRCDSCQILEMAAPLLSRWKSWLKTTGQMNMAKVRMFEGLHCKVEPDLDMISAEAALDRLLENRVVRDIPRAEGAGMKHLTTRWEKTWRKRATRSGSTKFASWDVNTDGRSSGKTCLPQELHTALDELDILVAQTSCAYFSLWIARMLTIRLLSWRMWW